VLAQPLTQRVTADERLELGREVGVPPGREIGLDALLDGEQPQLLETLGIRPGEELVGDVGERRPAPERQGVPQRSTRLVGTTRRELGARRTRAAARIE
jgi:hypothetical protein